jgi:hypothetical protein
MAERLRQGKAIRRLRRKFSTVAENRTGCSMLGKWPTPSNTTVVAFGSLSCRVSTMWWISGTSRLPTMSSVGTRMPPIRPRAGGAGDVS